MTIEREEYYRTLNGTFLRITYHLVHFNTSIEIHETKDGENWVKLKIE